MKNVLQNQIASQIEGKYNLAMTFADGHEEAITLIEQNEEFWIKPICCRYKKISETHFAEILAMSDLARDGDVRDGAGVSDLSFDSFFSKYYNLA